MINTLKRKGDRIEAKLSLYQFKDDGAYILYCPALDLSGYGNTRKESRESFECVLNGYLEYCIENDTLRSDLTRHGWTVDGVIESPSIKKMLRNNKTLEDIIFGKDYVKLSETVDMPAIV